MAILLSNFVWEGTSLDMESTVGAKNGHIFKQLDTGESYIRISGVWKFINLGLSFIKATKSGSVITNASGFYHVSFATPFINNQYTVTLTCQAVSSNQPPVAFFNNIATNGFDIYTYFSRTGNPRPSTVVSWLATRDYNP